MNKRITFSLAIATLVLGQNAFAESAASSLEHWHNLCGESRAAYWNQLCAGDVGDASGQSLANATESLTHWRNLCGQSRGEYWDRLCRGEGLGDSVRLVRRDERQ